MLDIQGVTSSPGSVAQFSRQSPRSAFLARSRHFGTPGGEFLRNGFDTSRAEA